jgi:hypothetical protein
MFIVRDFSALTGSITTGLGPVCRLFVSSSIRLSVTEVNSNFCDIDFIVCSCLCTHVAFVGHCHHGVLCYYAG